MISWIKGLFKRRAGNASDDLARQAKLGFTRKFDSPIQKVREPLKDPEGFKRLVASYNVHLLNSMRAPDGRDIRELQEALRIADELVEMEPLRAIPWTFRAQIFLYLDLQIESEAAIKRAIEIDPSDPEKWGFCASVQAIQGKHSEAAQSRKRAKSLRS